MTMIDSRCVIHSRYLAGVICAALLLFATASPALAQTLMAEDEDALLCENHIFINLKTTCGAKSLSSKL